MVKKNDTVLITAGYYNGTFFKVRHISKTGKFDLLTGFNTTKKIKMVVTSLMVKKYDPDFERRKQAAIKMMKVNKAVGLRMMKKLKQK